MQKVTKYVIFKTKWGYFGLAGSEYVLCRTFLPLPEAGKIKSLLLKELSLENRASKIDFDKTFFKTVQERIAAYFEGVCVNFDPDIPVSLDGFSEFQKTVLTACRSVKFAQTITYGELARRSGRPAAARAVGNALAKNPLPLIIPCHRVIRRDGSLGGFSASGGKDTKVRLLRHEKATLATYKNG